MRRTTTNVYLLLLIVLGSVYYFLKNSPEPADITITLEPTEIVSYLFDARDGVPSSIRVESKSGGTVEVARTADGGWELKQPFTAAANSAAVESLASQVTTLRIEDTLPNIDLDVVGLKNPEYTLFVQFKENVERTAQIGVITPTESGYYVLTSTGDVVIVNKFSLDALLGLLTNPPYLETPTPSPTATETPLPTTVETVSPTPATTTPQP